MSKYIWKCSIVVPLLVIYLIFTRNVTISIPEINIYWDCSHTTFFCIIATFFLLGCSPLKKSCCNGHLTELLFNLVPVELISIFVFAQWHFTLTIILIISIGVFEILLFRCISNEEKKSSYSVKRHHHYKNIFKRCSVIVVLILTLIPCSLTIFVYHLHSPSYKAEEELWPIIVSDFLDTEEKSEPENIYIQHAKLLSCFSDNKWSEFDVSERITIMQKLVDFESELLGIPTTSVVAEKLNEYTLGKYDNEVKKIWIDVEHLMESSVKSCITTICHEVFHSAQHFLVDNIDWNNEVFQSAYFDELKSWRLNEEHYIDAGVSGYDAYESQPIEKSACEYAEKETTMILSYI